MRDSTRVVIIGGGVIGCSIAYHLAKLGWTDVVLIEKGQLASGTTWHAAGLVGQFRSSHSATRMLQMSVELYQQLEAEAEQPIGWKQTGGLAFELHIPCEYAAYVYETLWEAGQQFAVANVGYRAIDSLRLEKGRRCWSRDITPRTTPYEAGLGRFVALEKGEFLGRDALVRAEQETPGKRLCCFLLTEPVDLNGGETILHNGDRLGLVTSGGYGYTIGKTIAYGYLPVERIDDGEYEIEVFSERIPAKLHDGPVL